jgi:hypothetical protein
MSHSTGPVYRPRPDDAEPIDDREPVSSSRLYLAEPGWRLGVKNGSDREFCYMMAPGQDFYHRLLDGEIFLHRHAEKLCLACASRRGLLVAEPRRLREVVINPPPVTEETPLELGWYDVKTRDVN